MKSYQQDTLLKKMFFLQIYKYMNIKIYNEIIIVKFISVIRVIKIIYKFYIQSLIQNINYSV